MMLKLNGLINTSKITECIKCDPNLKYTALLYLYNNE